MDQMPPKTDRIATLRRYAAGELGTREAIERAGFDDFADLLIAMAQADLAMPRPSDTPARPANIARATDMLQPLLRRGH